MKIPHLWWRSSALLFIPTWWCRAGRCWMAGRGWSGWRRRPCRRWASSPCPLPPGWSGCRRVLPLQPCDRSWRISGWPIIIKRGIHSTVGIKLFTWKVSLCVCHNKRYELVYGGKGNAYNFIIYAEHEFNSFNLQQEGLAVQVPFILRQNASTRMGNVFTTIYCYIRGQLF